MQAPQPSSSSIREGRESPVRTKGKHADRLAAVAIVARLSKLPRPEGLSRREAEFLPWLATDLGYSAIAREIGYGPDNARLVAKRLLTKLGVQTRSAAVARWLQPEAFRDAGVQ